MDHPNIAQVLDGGATPSGRPYFVMEFVRGMPITNYCDQANLSTRERLELFIKVCRAVQHAHRKGVIHRDLKPSNVLVTLHDGEPVPKVIDFGVAKALGQKLTDKTLFTRFEQMIGPPAYMSPEQAALSGLHIDTRSDKFDELAKGLAQSATRRGALKKFGLGLAGFALLAGALDLCTVAAEAVDLLHATITQNFSGSTINDCANGAYCAAPDCSGAVGPEHFVELINNHYAVYRKLDGVRLQSMTMDAFWTGPGISLAFNGQPIGPQVLFD